MTDYSKDFGPEYNEFPTDEHRRVVGNLTVPRSLDGLTRTLDKDPNTRLGITAPDSPNADRLQRVLKDCVDSGWVTKLSDSMEPEEVLAEANKDKDSIDIPSEMGKSWVSRAKAGRRSDVLGEGPNYIISKVGMGKLNGTIFNEPPPLVGDALLRALERNLAKREAAVEAEESAEGRTKEQISSAKAALKEAQAALKTAQAEQNGGSK